VTSVLHAPTIAGEQIPAAPALPALEERGTTSISATVIQKIAGRAASEVRGVDTAEPSALRRFIPFVADGAADAEVGSERTSVDLTISVRYPEPVWERAAAVRERVSDRICELTGLRAVRVDIAVTQIVASRSRSTKRVV
jgi:uncharacterized alkaline shock family protein YloU